MTKTTEAAPEPASPVIVVGVSAIAGPAAVIQLAAMLAQLRRGSLHGLFIEDEDLLNVAGLPFSQEILQFGGQARDFSNLNLERTMARLAAEFRRLLVQQAESRSLSWTYSSIRSNRGGLVETTPADLLIISPAAGKSPGTAIPQRILLLGADRPSVQKALLSVLEASRPGPIELIIATTGRAVADKILEQLNLNQLQQAWPGLNWRTVSATDPAQLLTTAKLRPSLVVLPRDSGPSDINTCLRLASCPVVVAS
ncbi:MAG: hypothetical protein ABJ308_13920 [Halieaceae bacterium]